MSTTSEQSPHTGDPCPACGDQGGHLIVTTSKRRRSLVVRYFACWRCGSRPPINKAVVPASDVPTRRPRKNRPNKVQTAEATVAVSG